MYTPGTITNLQRTPTKIDKNWYCQSKNFSGASDFIRHFKIFRRISNKMPVLLLTKPFLMIFYLFADSFKEVC